MQAKGKPCAKTGGKTPQPDIWQELARQFPMARKFAERISRQRVFIQSGFANQNLLTKTIRKGGCLLLLLLLAGRARADRVLLAPDGNTLGPQDFKAEFAISPHKGEENLSWVQFGLKQGAELELQRFDLATDTEPRMSLSAQYPLFTDFGPLPALSIGVRDLLGTGVEHRSFYVAADKSLLFSDRRLRWLRELRFNVGAGTERLGGLFAGAQIRFAPGLSLYTEVYRHRLNLCAALPLARNLQVRAYSLDGAVFYGLTYTLIH